MLYYFYFLTWRNTRNLLNLQHKCCCFKINQKKKGGVSPLKELIFTWGRICSADSQLFPFLLFTQKPVWMQSGERKVYQMATDTALSDFVFFFCRPLSQFMNLWCWFFWLNGFLRFVDFFLETTTIWTRLKSFDRLIDRQGFKMKNWSKKNIKLVSQEGKSY